ncbi:MAG: tRNA (adenosine(37)-N6)-threonylcarbamoyltransferase complex ATPase subunit type 1 TsaE [Myxococcota bacterium]
MNRDQEPPDRRRRIVCFFSRLDDEAATLRFGRELAELLRPGDVLLLEGELGAGKSTLVRAIGRALGIPEEVPMTSPTFTLVNEYPARIPLVHADLYRLSDPEEIIELGLEERIGEGHSVVAVEWGLAFRASLEPVTAILTLSFETGTQRALNLVPLGARGQELAETLANPR